MKVISPDHLWFNGAIVPWKSAQLHAWSEAATRGASVFEGIRAYWHDESGSYWGLGMPEHMRRLYQSAKLLRFPPTPGPGALLTGMMELLATLDFQEDAYLRPTLYLDDSHGGGAGATDVTTGSYVVCFKAPRLPDVTTVRCGVSSWRRPGDLTLSPRIKSGAGFLSLRLPRIEAAERGFDEMIMLNDRDSVAEATGSNVFIVRNGTAITPPVTVGLLEGVTRERLLRLLPAVLGVPAVEREIGRSELYAADEIFLCSTLNEVVPVVQIDGFTVGTGEPGPISLRIREHYLAMCAAGPDAEPGWLQRLTT